MKADKLQHLSYIGITLRLIKGKTRRIIGDIVDEVYLEKGDERYFLHRIEKEDKKGEFCYRLICSYLDERGNVLHQLPILDGADFRELLTKAREKGWDI